jgi:superfamily I DNA/RNA helicase
MTQLLEDDVAPWRRCELAWSGWLQSDSFVVTHLSEAIGNTSGSQAPLMSMGGRRRRAPDFQTMKAGICEYWEVKFRAHSDADSLTGERYHWTERSAFADYLAVSDATRCKVWLIVYEAATATHSGRWLRADIHELKREGHSGKRFGQGGQELDAWVWPVSAMDIIVGPALDLDDTSIDLLPREGDQDALLPASLEPVERRLRRSSSSPIAGEPVNPTELADRLLSDDLTVGLDVLRRSLGIPTLPRYSVMRVGIKGIETDDLLGLLHYGIRVFIICEKDIDPLLLGTDIKAFRESRLLELSVVPSIEDEYACWIVDGVFPSTLSSGLQGVLDQADELGGINIQQFSIVHAPADADILITAGAGTGKTETMSERVIFLLATSRIESVAGQEVSSRPFDLRADEIVLVTFTRDAALEMRQRIARALLLRQRLCRRSVFPALAWMMQLGSADITTIHTYAKRLLQAGGAAVGVSPEFSVSRETMAFRAILNDILSPHLADMHRQYPKDVPAAHLWQRHVQALWDALENNGVQLMSPVSFRQEIPNLDWGTSSLEGVEAAVEETTRNVLNRLSDRFRDYCIEAQSVPTSELVPFALSAIVNEQTPRVRRPRYLFVDEFQDTDSVQMDLLLEIRNRLEARLFVVGDAKQGIYRFRGAEGNAFAELHKRVQARGLTDLAQHSLSRNFRSGRRLLDSLHPYFSAWSSKGLLTYGAEDRLRPQQLPVDESRQLESSQVSTRRIETQAAEQVRRWRTESPGVTIAVLCRQNWQALKVRSEIQAAGEPCELLVGGSFYTSPAVRELYLLLRAVAQPNDDSVVLQLCETRWAAGIMRGQPPFGISDPHLWESPLPTPRGWRDRLSSLATSESVDSSDLQPIRLRLQSIGSLLNLMPVMALIVECSRAFIPELSQVAETDDDSERNRYVRCFDHLLTLLDSNLKDGAMSLQRVLSWMELQIATNRSEDEPVEWDALKGKTVALTVHKAKGLEFDNVLVPYTLTKFTTPKGQQTRAAVLRPTNGTPRLIWQWKGGTRQPARYTNVSAQEAQQLWGSDDRETLREETRLLYVALTRAKTRLHVYLPYLTSRRSNDLSSWADLLLIGSITNG